MDKEIKICKHFVSYYEDYDNDEYEPKDQGFCKKDYNNNYCDYDIQKICKYKEDSKKVWWK